MKKLLVLLLLAATSIFAAQTEVTDTLYLADGSKLSGTVDISWPRFQAGTGEEVRDGRIAVSVTNGAFTVFLYPTDVATPEISYRVRYRLTGVTNSSEVHYWSVPTSGTALTIADVETSGPTSPSLVIALSQLAPGSAVKGDLIAFNGSSWVIFTGGSNDQYLVKDSTQAQGMKWYTPSFMNNPLTTLGDLLYGGSSGTPTRLGGNTAATKYFLGQTGTGSASAAPAWSLLADADIPDTISLTNITQITNRSHTSLTDIGSNTHSQIDTHLGSTSNPHSVTKSQVGLGSVENTALSTWAGTTNINTLGTINAGVWNGTVVDEDYLDIAWGTAKHLTWGGDVGIARQAATTLKISDGSTGWGNLYVRNLAFRHSSASQQIGLTLYEQTVAKWFIGKNTDNTFQIYDNANGANRVAISTGGEITLSPATTTTISGTYLTSPAFIRLGGATSSYGAIKNNSGVVESRLADDSAYAQHTAAHFVSASTGVGYYFQAGTASYPALKNSGTTLMVRLGDDSADAPFQAQNIYSSSGAVFVGGNAVTDIKLTRSSGTFYVRKGDDSGYAPILSLPGFNAGNVAIFGGSGQPINGNFAGWDGSGRTVDSGSKASDFEPAGITESDISDLGTAAAMVADKLDVFAATTSAELSTVLSDEVGNSGGYVRGTAGSTDDCMKWDANGNAVSAGAPCGSGGGAFTDLSDTPANYTSAANKFVKVNSTPDGLEFVAANAGTDITADLEEEGAINATNVTGNAGDDQVLLGSGANALGYATIPDCHTGYSLSYTQSTNTISCEADDVGAGGGDPVLVDTTPIADASGVDLTSGNSITIALNTAASPDTATFNCDDAAADGSTKGCAAYNATRFSASSGVVDIASVSGITGADEDDVSNDDLGGLQNVTESTPGNDEILQYVTDHWENQTLAEAGIEPALGFTPENTANKNAASGYAGLTAGTKLTASQGQEVWALADLSNATEDTSTDNDLWVYVTDHWENQTLAEAGVEPALGFTPENSANKGAVSGYASLDGSQLVVENPANATATPTASKIVVAEGDGDINAGWISQDSSYTWTAAHDFSGGNLELPNNTSPISADCDDPSEYGRITVDTDATSGQQVYVCESGGWTLQGDGGGSPAADSVGTTELDDGADTPGSGDYVRVDTVDQAGFEYRTPSEVLSDIGAASSTHASTHADGAADELTVENLATACTDAQVLGGDGLGGVECQTDQTGAGITAGTVSSIPGSPSDGDQYIVTDGTYVGDVTTGGGTDIPRYQIIYDGDSSSWRTVAIHNDLIFNVKDFGACGDGVCDDTAEIQAAITAAAAAGESAANGATVYFPPGKYYVSDPLVLPRTGVIADAAVSLLGASPVVSRIQATGSWSAGEAVIEWAVTADRTRNHEIGNLYIGAPAVAGTYAIHYEPTDCSTYAACFAEYAKSLYFHDLIVGGSNTYNDRLIYLEGCIRFSTFERIACDPSNDDTGYDTICLYANNYDDVTWSGEYANGDYIGINYSRLVSIDSTYRRDGNTATFRGRLSASTVDGGFNNGSRTGVPGWDISMSSGTTISNILTEGRGEDPQILLKDSNQIHIKNSTIGGPTSHAGGGVGNGIEFTNCDDCSWDGRTWSSLKPTFSSSGVDVIVIDTDSDNTRITNFDITGDPANEITDSGTNTYMEIHRLDGGDVRYVIGTPLDQRQGTDVASASTISLAQGQSRFRITGTTAITTINYCNAQNKSREVTLWFAGAASVTDGTSINLAGGKNFQAAADDTLTLACMYDGSNYYWHEIGRGQAPAPREFGFLIGADGSGTPLTVSEDQDSIFRNSLGFGITIEEIWCETNTGTADINLQRDDGSPANILTSDLQCTTSGASSTGFSGTENKIAATNLVDFDITAVASSPERVSLFVKYSID